MVSTGGQKKKSTKTRRQTANGYYVILLLAGLLYGLVTYMAPIIDNRFDLSLAEMRALQASFILPILLIWLCALFGAIRFKNYALQIKASEDGKALAVLSSGLMILAVGIIVTTIFSGLRSYFVEDFLVTGSDAGLRIFTIASNYLAILFPLVGFGYIFVGGYRLMSEVAGRSWKPGHLIILLTIVSIVGSLYALMMLNNDFRNNTLDPLAANSYYLSDPLLMLTIVTPNVLTWALAGLGALSLIVYAHEVSGVIYRQALSLLVKGLISVVAFSVILQLLVTLTPNFNELGLGPILIIVYLIVALYAVGYLLIAKGANRLGRLEEI